MCVCGFQCLQTFVFVWFWKGRGGSVGGGGGGVWDTPTHTHTHHTHTHTHTHTHIPKPSNPSQTQQNNITIRICVFSKFVTKPTQITRRICVFVVSKASKPLYLYGFEVLGSWGRREVPPGEDKRSPPPLASSTHALFHSYSKLM